MPMPRAILYASTAFSNNTWPPPPRRDSSPRDIFAGFAVTLIAAADASASSWARVRYSLAAPDTKYRRYRHIAPPLLLHTALRQLIDDGDFVTSTEESPLGTFRHALHSAPPLSQRATDSPMALNTQQRIDMSAICPF